ncbi:MAG TPA: hypothetical protein VJ044_09630 [Candidatus Hodarchaeales archaeon]|nr:hypothetical protein [Candidatus Hodarchaeales archaeon]
MKGEGAWYAKSGSKLGEVYTIMHLPYTSMVLSYVLIGAAVSPSFYPNRVTLTLLAYFLGLGLSAHALNELHARHWGEALSKRELEILFAVPLIGAILIGAYGMTVLYATSGDFLAPFVLLGFIFLETFFLFAYNIDFFGGRFHSDLSFALSWAALPVLISYYVNALTITPVAILAALAMAATASIEINLSRWCKDFRRRSLITEVQFVDNTKLKLTTAELIARPEKALKLIVVAVDLLAIALIVYKLLP